MVLADAHARSFDAWNDHDPAGVVASLSDGGTYEDPTTAGLLAGDALAASVQGLVTGFPDVHFDLVSGAPTGEVSAAAQWVMTGTNTGPMPGGPATGGSISHTGRSTVSGAFTVTWVDIDPEYQFTLVDATSNIVMEQLGNDGYLGASFATVGRRNYTFTAWESVDAARAALRGEAHGAAMRLASSDGLGDDAHGVTSIWSPEVLNGVFHPGAGRSRDLAELEGQWL